MGCYRPKVTFVSNTWIMRKSILLFFLLIFSIVLWKVTESNENEQLNDTTVEELVLNPEARTIAEK